MGRPFLSELGELEKTYDEAMGMDIEILSSRISRNLGSGLLSVGSGGSFSAASYACHLHQMATGEISKPMTPLGVVQALNDPMAKQFVGKSAVICITAGGSNSDIKKVWQILAKEEPRDLLALCARTNSKIAKESSCYEYPLIYDFDLSSKKDGFLATNSLLAFLVILYRAYMPFLKQHEALPQNIWDLLPFGNNLDSAINHTKMALNSVLEREYIAVMFSSEMLSAAIDMESKFTEAALASVQISDMRNYAHGRHHWLAKHAAKSSVIAFSSSQDAEMARRTLNLIPSTVSSHLLEFSDSTTKNPISAIIAVYLMSYVAGINKKIDPGRPGVPQYGRLMYHQTMRTGKLESIQQAVKRKSRIAVQEASTIDKAYRIFKRKLEKTKFCALAFDYDGTLSWTEGRYGPLSKKLANELIRILGSSVPVCIATGRGKSVRKVLQDAIPSEYWDKVLIGYYNGGDCALLSRTDKPDGSNVPCKELLHLTTSLRSDADIATAAELTVRKRQISITPKGNIPFDSLWDLTDSHIHSMIDVKMFRSAHSIDVIPASVSKVNAIKEMRRLFKLEKDSPVLCIGDQGRWPGNDFELLSLPYSLSVDEVSTSLDTCWNMAPPGVLGPQATLHYLKCIEDREGVFSFRSAHRLKG